MRGDESGNTMAELRCKGSKMSGSWGYCCINLKWFNKHNNLWALASLNGWRWGGKHRCIHPTPESKGFVIAKKWTQVNAKQTSRTPTVRGTWLQTRLPSVSFAFLLFKFGCAVNQTTIINEGHTAVGVTGRSPKAKSWMACGSISENRK